MKTNVRAVCSPNWRNGGHGQPMGKYRSKPMPLALRQLRTVLVEISQSEVEADQKTARHLLTQYFRKD